MTYPNYERSRVLQEEMLRTPGAVRAAIFGDREAAMQNRAEQERAAAQSRAMEQAQTNNILNLVLGLSQRKEDTLHQDALAEKQMAFAREMANLQNTAKMDELRLMYKLQYGRHRGGGRRMERQALDLVDQGYQIALRKGGRGPAAAAAVALREFNRETDPDKKAFAGLVYKKAQQAMQEPYAPVPNPGRPIRTNPGRPIWSPQYVPVLNPGRPKRNPRHRQPVGFAEAPASF